MQLDQTHVAVRVRTLSEIGDLALVLLHRYPTTLLVGFTLGALPWIVADGLLLYWIPITEAQFGLDDSEAFTELCRYAAWMALLVFLQTPAAGVITTIYLGEAVFEHKPTWRSAYQVARKQFWRWFYCLGVRRLAIPAMLLVAVRMFEPFHSGFDVAAPIAIFFAALLIRAGRPFLPEMILLERCPLRSKDPQEITLRRRARALHRPVGNDVGSRWLTISGTLVVIFAGLFYSLVWARGVTTGYWNFGLFTWLVLYPLALWTVGGLSVIVRMLAYLDTRIRLEGWDVELAVRAEAIRQFGAESEPTGRTSAAEPTSTGDNRLGETLVAGAGGTR
ncbi:hypothetical protein FYK55_10930 [Roseiconus nitratireducens]|uniref:Uncharacterized protein n=1 Tax=Roseiconus nitratireducens TaxID=2605748 RepID=A0A5M6DBC8_9BACT|nr:hypothetical protein [Roseiconus nitratireducens]KAA5543700.1 hypothetical protein FYK55_10930 [Roseiconus nitratireducens]